MILKHQHFEILQKTVLERLIFEPPLKADGTMHNEACFLYAVNGNSKLYAATQQEDLNSSEGVVMKCGNYLNNWKKSTTDEPTEAIAIHFYPEVMKLVYDDEIPDFLRSKKEFKTVLIEKVKINHLIESYMGDMLFYFENPSLINDELIKLKVKELILLLVKSDESGRVLNILKDLFNPEKYEFKDVVASNMYEDLSVEDLAILTGLSVSSFKRKFSEIFDESPARYMKNKRLDKAAELLSSTNMRISEICYKTGFGDPTHFTKSFSEKFNISPSEYRNHNLS
jgi:AraC-like DNA-binding protein